MSSEYSKRDLYEVGWAEKTSADRTDLLRVDAMLERIAYLEEVRAKLEKDIEFGDTFSTSPRSLDHCRRCICSTSEFDSLGQQQRRD